LWRAPRNIQGTAILDAEVVWLGLDGIAQFDALHSRVNDGAAIALAFDLLMHNGEDVRRRPFAERKAILRKVLQRTRRGIQYVEHTEGDSVEMFKAVCKLGLEGIVSKKLDAPYARQAARTSPTTTGPLRGAARGAAGGAIGGAIAGNAGRGAGIGAAVGAGLGTVRGGAQRSQSYQWYFDRCMSR
jgi:hypothetical protein